jgi:uncharacterized protein YggE
MAGADEALPRVIVVVGDGVASAVPDRCVIGVSLRVMRDTVADAIRDVASMADAAMVAMREAGVEEADLGTRNLNVQDWIDHQQQRVTARIATYAFTIAVNGVDGVSALVTALSASAGDSLQINGITFSHSDAEPLRAVARREAVADARTRAEQLAAAAGLRLGDVVAIHEGAAHVGAGGFVARAVRGRASGEGTPPMPIMPGDQTVRVTVEVTYAIAPSA